MTLNLNGCWTSQRVSAISDVACSQPACQACSLRLSNRAPRPQALASASLGRVPASARRLSMNTTQHHSGASIRCSAAAIDVEYSEVASSSGKPKDSSGQANHSNLQLCLLSNTFPWPLKHVRGCNRSARSPAGR